MAATTQNNGGLMESSGNPALNLAAFQKAEQQGGTSDAKLTTLSVYLRAGLLLLVMIIAAIFGWSQTEVFSIGNQQVVDIPPATWCISMIAFIVAMVGIFAYKAAAVVGFIYMLCQGFVIGVVCRAYAVEYDGIVAQAIVVTLAIFLGMLILYSTKIIKVTPGFVSAIVVAMSGLLLGYFVIWLLSLFDPRIGVLFFTNTPIGIGLAVFIVVLAALSLAPDFKFIEMVAASGAPSYMAWYAAFGLVLGIIWLFVSVLRLLALSRR
ncbi:MAG: Bax inhibitor 1 like protein [Chloroflexi bacterium OLB15]|nr:MAG: Bax inhibitor 1 like protein [Chloroflexi bacterium OLB15]